MKLSEGERWEPTPEKAGDWAKESGVAPATQRSDLEGAGNPWAPRAGFPSPLGSGPSPGTLEAPKPQPLAVEPLAVEPLWIAPNSELRPANRLRVVATMVLVIATASGLGFAWTRLFASSRPGAILDGEAFSKSASAERTIYERSSGSTGKSQQLGDSQASNPRPGNAFKPALPPTFGATNGAPAEVKAPAGRAAPARVSEATSNAGADRLDDSRAHPDFGGRE
jgi:hypothetical protein